MMKCTFLDVRLPSAQAPCGTTVFSDMFCFNSNHSRHTFLRKLIPYAQDLGANAYTGLECTPNPVFLKQDYSVPFFLQPIFGPILNIEPMQFHILAMATFASLIAPFGGFFASGLKRTFKIKDFGDLVPGHGGMTGMCRAHMLQAAHYWTDPNCF